MAPFQPFLALRTLREVKSCGWHPHLALQTLKKLDKKGAPLLPSPKSFMLQGLIKMISIQSIVNLLVIN